MAAEEVKLLTVSISPYAMRAEFALSVKGVKHEKVQQDLGNKSQLLLESNPVHKKVPVLIHNGKPVSESTIIVQYIDEAWPSPDGKDLLPKDPYDRGIARFWADYADKKLFASLFRIISTDGEKQQKAVEESMECFTTMEGALGSVPKEPPFFGGASVGYVDAIMSPIVVWYPALESVGDFKIPFEEKFSRLCAWIKAMQEYAQCLPDPERITKQAHVIRARRIAK